MTSPPRRHVLDNATLWIGDGRSHDGHIAIVGDTIEAARPGRYAGDLPCTDLAGAALSPGLVDIMLCGGFNFSLVHDDPVEIARRYLPLGVTTCQMAVGTLTDDHQVQLCQNAMAAMAYDGLDASWISGVYWEGPFYDPECVGGNNRDLVWPATRANVARFLEVCGPTATMVSVSPGLKAIPRRSARSRTPGKS